MDPLISVERGGGHAPGYPPEYRAQIVELVRSGLTAASVAHEYELSVQTILNWVRQADLERTHWTEIFHNFLPDIFTTLTFNDSPRDVDSAIGPARKHTRHISGALQEPVLRSLWPSVVLKGDSCTCTSCSGSRLRQPNATCS